MRLKKVKSFVIDVKKWLRGEGSKRSSLHRKSDGKMCCVGQYLEACGAPPESFLGLAEISETDYRIVGFNGADGVDTDATPCLYSDNDTRDITEAERREKIRAGFRALRVKVSFSDELKSTR